MRSNVLKHTSSKLTQGHQDPGNVCPKMMRLPQFVLELFTLVKLVNKIQNQTLDKLLPKSAPAPAAPPRWTAPSESVSVTDSSGSTMIALRESKFYTVGPINIDIYLIRHCGPDGAHEDISCEEGQIVIVNYAATEHTWLWQCGDDDGRCPGAFQVGCEPDDSYTTTTIDPDNSGNSAISLFSFGPFGSDFGLK